MKHQIIQGDCLETLGTLPDDHFQTCITSPPYWLLRDYETPGQIGLEESLKDHLQALVQVFQQVRRVLRPDGTLWVNYGDKYAGGGGGGSSAIETRKPEYGRETKAYDKCNGRLNGRSSLGLGFKNKDLMGLPWRLAFALQADGWWLRSDIVWNKPDAMPQAVTDRPASAHEFLFLLSPAAKYYYNADAVEPRGANGDRVNLRDVWNIPSPGFGKLPHFATFPPALVEPCIKAGSRPGDHVLDPFGGAGTVGLVADRLGRSCTLLELNPEYIETAKQRIYSDAPLFCEVETK